MRKKSSARFESDHWRHVAYAAVAVATAWSIVLDRREVHLARLLAGRRVVDRALATGRARDALASDPVSDGLQLGRHRCTHVCLPRVSFALAYRR